jgi:hypothetical protein
MTYDPDPNVMRMMTSEEMAVVEAGARAGRAGEPIEANPHPEKSDPWFSWRSGWRRPSMYIGDEA